MKYNEMQSYSHDEWIHRVKEQWTNELNAAKMRAFQDETCRRTLLVSSRCTRVSLVLAMNFEKALNSHRIRLFESCTIVNIDDLVVYPVSLSNSKENKRHRPLVKSDRTQYQLPEYLGVIHIQHTEYYYPSPYSFPGRDVHRCLLSTR
jgi:hypothetical protein